MKQVILEIREGDFQNGFKVLLQTDENVSLQGRLPSTGVGELYEQWRLTYNQRVSGYRGIKKVEDSNEPRNVSVGESSKDVETELNTWLSYGKEFGKIRDRLLKIFEKQSQECSPLVLIIKTDNAEIRKLPWNLWNLLEDYQVEAVNSLVNYHPNEKHNSKASPRVEILAILGDKRGIDYQRDRLYLEQLKSFGANPTFLVEPERQEIGDLLWDDPWDILYFAGHSDSKEGKGRLYINPNDSLTIDELRWRLKKAIAKGLKIAIFNSCDGLKLAENLADLNIPQIIVMREPVPDRVAQRFLKDFLKAFSRGAYFYPAVREARQKLQILENEFPCASWLPTVYQNPAEVVLTWEALRNRCQGNKVAFHYRDRQPFPRRPTRTQIPKRNLVFQASIIVAICVIMVRSLGWLQPLEMQSYDQFMRWRPVEGPDPRILVVTNDKPDIDYQDEREMERTGSLSDEALMLLLDRLEKIQPQIIGFDIYHEHPFNSALATRLNNNPRFFTICKRPSDVNNEDLYGIGPSQEIPKERIGFSDFSKDPDNIVRRHLLAMTLKYQAIEHDCRTKFAFSYRIAYHYLKAIRASAGFATANLEVKQTPRQEWQFVWGGSENREGVILNKLKAWSGGYQGTGHVGGYQILLNYRPYSSWRDICHWISLKTVLEEGIPDEEIENLRGSIILIGTVEPSYRDIWTTPYNLRIPGVFLQAQAISQIISAVLDGRPLIKWLHPWVEMLWISLWSFLGAILVLSINRPFRLLISGGIAIVGLITICWVLFLQQMLWIPLFPPAIALCATTVLAVWLYRLSPVTRSNPLERQL